MKRIPLTQGKFALVDDEDYTFLIQWKWYFSGRYAVRSESLQHEDGTRFKPRRYMHRDINRTPLGVQTDHIDGNGLNNRRRNLRDATCAENQRNCRRTKGSSKYKGVQLTNRGVYVSHIKVSGKSIYLGSFGIDEIKAAKAYNKAALKYHGKYASLNKL